MVIADINIGLDRVSLVEIDAEVGQLLCVLADHPVVGIDEVITPHSWDGPAVLACEHEQPGQMYPNGRLSDFANAVAQRFPDHAGFNDGEAIERTESEEYLHFRNAMGL